MEHGIVYRNDREFCGWPFIHGFWRNGSGDLLLGFKRSPANYDAPEDIHHDRIAVKPGSQVVAIRSRDKAQSWDAAGLVTLWDFAAGEAMFPGDGAADYAAHGPIDFSAPDTLVACGATPGFGLPESRAWVRVSKDGGDSWLPPIRLPLTGLASLSGNASAMVRQDGRSLLFLTHVSADGWTRRAVVYASLDGGTAWTFLAMVTPRDDDGAADGNWTGSFRFGGHRWFYPRAIQLRDGRILCSIRCQRDPTGVMWTEMFESADAGLTWRFLSRVNEWGAPGDIVQMQDGRIACVYGYRLPPYGIRARISEDGGRSWGREIVLRDDGGSWDLGYPRVTELEPGRLAAFYYFNRQGDPVRHIAQTLFTP